ncbi:hypothetical protein Tco_1389968 [Tanacetum coccineum]
MQDHSWIELIQDELHQFERLNVWELVPRPADKNIIRVKWLWKNKTDVENTVNQKKQNLGLVAKSSQGRMLDFDELIAPWLDLRQFECSLLCASQELHNLSNGCQNCISEWTIERRIIHVNDGEMKFFLGLKVHQPPHGIFISQLQYTLEVLKKHGMDGCDSISTPMATAKLDTDFQGTPTDQTKYHNMIRGLMYLTADVDHAGCHDDCKSTSGGIQFLREKLNTTLGLGISFRQNFDVLRFKERYCYLMQSGTTLVYKTYQHPLPFNKEHVEQGTVELYFVKAEYQLADLFTKALPIKDLRIYFTEFISDI